MTKITAEEAWRRFDGLSLTEQEAVLTAAKSRARTRDPHISDEQLRPYQQLYEVLERKVAERRLGEHLAEFLPVDNESSD